MQCSQMTEDPKYLQLSERIWMQINIRDYSTLHLDTKSSTGTILLFAGTVAAPILQLSSTHYICRVMLPLCIFVVSMFSEQENQKF
jgi:hypothetical protein